MFDFQNDTTGDVVLDTTVFTPIPAFNDSRMPPAKRAFDCILAIFLLVPLAMSAVILVLLNPFMNTGPLVFRQQRMGHQCQPFTALKFRSMLPATQAARGAFDALETDRITWLGHLIRRSRIDELPQVLNVLRGEMSLIGPRPDSYDHACVYVREIPGYAERHRVMPGISGFAQTEVGYVDGLDGVKRKVAADTYYIANATFRFDLWIVWRTLCVVLGRRGA